LKLLVYNFVTMAKLTWYSTYTTTVKYSAEITDEEAQLFNDNPEEFFESVDYESNKVLEWDEISGEDDTDFELE
jgi:hypothetical protein